VGSSKHSSYKQAANAVFNRNSVILRKNKSAPRWIVVKTETNGETAGLFFYFEIEVSHLEEYIRLNTRVVNRCPPLFENGN